MGRLNPESRRGGEFLEDGYKELERELEMLVPLSQDPDLPVYQSIPEIAESYVMFTRSLRILEELVNAEVSAYVAMHSGGKKFIPHTIQTSFFNAKKIVKAGEVAIGLSVEPEGCAYAYFFEAQGLPVVHVSADFDGRGGIDYIETEDLGVLTGKHVLLIEDDIRTGLTLGVVLSNLEKLGIAKLSLFLGNWIQYQILESVPKEISTVHLNTSEDEGIRRKDQEFFEFFGQVHGLFEKHEIFRDGFQVSGAEII